MLVAGDIGGTKTLLAAYAPDKGASTPLAQVEFRSASYDGLEPIVREFLAQTGLTARAACFDVAGPVIGGRAHLTNLPWIVEEEALRQALGLERVTLLNDLKAIAYAVPRLRPTDLETIIPGRADPTGAIGVVAPGTGLGEAFLVWNGGEYVACSSEGGHSSFAPADDRQIELLRYLSRKLGHVSCERVCAGPGIANIYDFLRDTNAAPESPAFAALLAQAADRTPLISQAGLDDPEGNPLAAATLELFVSILGSESGNMALKVLATGGIYLAGGIPGHILPLLRTGRFTRAFVDKGRFAEMLGRLPVHVVTAPAALLGAALYGLDHLNTT